MPYFFDSYAFMAFFVEGKNSYKKYFEDEEEKYTSFLSLMEIYSWTLHGINQDKADDILGAILPHFSIVPLDDIDTVKRAAKFRSQMLKGKKSLSYADCVNYALAQKLNMKLLTGDEDFRSLKGVEFVK
ncbi:MAG: PIN domain-containing protein [Candidatus Altiarchaeota archaeon]